MTNSMLAGVQEFLTPSFLSRVSSQTGESEDAVSKGFTALVPTLLASIADRSSDSSFMSRLVSLATNTASDTDFVASPSRSQMSQDAVESGSGFTTLVLCQLFNVFNARSDRKSAFVELFSNKWLWAAVALSVALQCVVLYTPFLQRAFSTQALSGSDWLFCAVIASSVLWLREAEKLVYRRSVSIT